MLWSAIGTGEDFMTETPNLGLPFIMEAQAQKHVTHNEAIRALDALVQLAVSSRIVDTPPSAPADGDRYIIAPGASGAWAAKDGQVAAFQDGAWSYFPPGKGWIAWVADEARVFGFDGTIWSDIASVSQNNVPFIGINTNADASNRLALSSASSLFNHDGAGHQVKVNKNSASDTASLLFQTGFGGRAEIGLAGDDDFHFKVSPDGATFYDALRISNATGNIGFIGNADPAWPLTITPGTTGSTTLGGMAFNPGVINRVTSGRVGFLVEVSNNFLSDGSTNGNAGFGFAFPFDGNFDDYRVFRILRGVNLTDRFYVKSDGSAYFAGRVGIGAENPGAELEVAGAIKPGSYTVSTAPSAALKGAGAMIYVSDESGGPAPAFSDGANWRRMSDGTVIS